jgi:hypothetical protein
MQIRQVNLQFFIFLTRLRGPRDGQKVINKCGARLFLCGRLHLFEENRPEQAKRMEVKGSERIGWFD